MKSGNELLKRYDTFIFDWDGTLTRMRLLLRLNENFKRLTKTWNNDDALKTVEKDRKELKGKIAAEETKNNILSIFVDGFLFFSRPRLHRDSMEVISLLKKHHKKIAILSNSGGSRLIREMNALGVLGKFDLIVSAKDIGMSKPDPRGLRKTIKDMSASPSRTLYLGDMCDDILTADLAKVSSCAISAGFDSHHRLKSAKPDYIFKSMTDLNRALSGK